MQYIFVDESGDPGKTYKIVDGKKIPTGASQYYIVTALPVTSEELFSLEQKIIAIKHKYKFKNEIKSTIIPLPMYKDLLKALKQLNIKSYYHKKLHNIFDEYNLVKTVYYAAKEKKFVDAEVVIDRAERRLLNGSFDNFDKYLFKRLNSKTTHRIKFINHANSEYVFIMQLSDLVCGVIKDSHYYKNRALKQILGNQLLRKIW